MGWLVVQNCGEEMLTGVRGVSSSSPKLFRRPSTISVTSSSILTSAATHRAFLCPGYSFSTSFSVLPTYAYSLEADIERLTFSDIDRALNCISGSRRARGDRLSNSYCHRCPCTRKMAWQRLIRRAQYVFLTKKHRPGKFPFISI